MAHRGLLYIYIWLTEGSYIYMAHRGLIYMAHRGLLYIYMAHRGLLYIYIWLTEGSYIYIYYMAHRGLLYIWFTEGSYIYIWLTEGSYIYVYMTHRGLLYIGCTISFTSWEQNTARDSHTVLKCYHHIYSHTALRILIQRTDNIQKEMSDNKAWTKCMQ